MKYPSIIQVILKVGGIQYGFNAWHFENSAYVVDLVPARTPRDYDRNSGDYLDAEPHSFYFEGKWVKPARILTPAERHVRDNP